MRVLLVEGTFASSVECVTTNPSGSDLALDGNYNSDFYHCTCFAKTDHFGVPNWWAVDMGQLFFLHQRIATNPIGNATVTIRTFLALTIFLTSFQVVSTLTVHC